MEKQKNTCTEQGRSVPKLRFPEFNGEWDFKGLSEVSNISRGKSRHRPRDAEFLYGGTYPFIQTSDIKNAELFLTDYNQTYSEAGLKQSKIWEENTLCVTIAANIAETAILKIKACFPDSIIGLIPYKECADVIFIKYQFDKYKLDIQKLSQGVAQDNLNQEKLSNLKFYFPSLPEQQKIAAFLTSVDERIAQLTKKKTLLEQYKKGVMQKIFSQEIRFKDDNGREFGEWNERKFGDITYKVGEKNKENVQYPIYSINNKEGFIPQGDQFDGMDSNDRGYDISLYKIVYKNTFAYNPARINVGSIGFSGELDKVLISSLYVCFKTVDVVNDSFILQYLKSYSFKKSVLRSVEGGVREYLFYENFSGIKIMLPTYEEQTKIANFLLAIDKKIEGVDKQLEQTKLWKKGLLQQMFC